jgi:hypothetical protein
LLETEIAIKSETDAATQADFFSIKENVIFSTAFNTVSDFLSAVDDAGNLNVNAQIQNAIEAVASVSQGMLVPGPGSVLVDLPNLPLTNITVGEKILQVNSSRLSCSWRDMSTLSGMLHTYIHTYIHT